MYLVHQDDCVLIEFSSDPSLFAYYGLPLLTHLRGASKLVRGFRQNLTEEERFTVANDVVNQLEDGGWRLSEELREVSGKGLLNAANEQTVVSKPTDVDEV